MAAANNVPAAREHHGTSCPASFQLSQRARTASDNFPLHSRVPVVETPSLWSKSSKKGLVMSQHNSLKGGGTVGAKRSVLKRFERVEILKKRGDWKEGDKVTGLRKTKPVG